MARVTVEDCLTYIDNRFTLVHVTSQRVKQLFNGSSPIIACKNREVVTALREIADGKILTAQGSLTQESPVRVGEERRPQRTRRTRK